MVRFIAIPVLSMIIGLLAAVLWAFVSTAALQQASSGYNIVTVLVFLVACVSSAVLLLKFRRR